LNFSPTKLCDIGFEEGEELKHCRNMESSMLREREEEKERGTRHPKSKNKRRKVSSLDSLHFFLGLCVFVFLFYA